MTRKQDSTALAEALDVSVTEAAKPKKVLVLEPLDENQKYNFRIHLCEV